MEGFRNVICVYASHVQSLSGAWLMTQRELKYHHRMSFNNRSGYPLEHLISVPVASQMEMEETQKYG